ncbi:MAG: hypothetical protein MJ102_09615, partial [Clostridia bacterium]|nr:hypothetical protein [Clostridia bacterium]
MAKSILGILLAVVLLTTACAITSFAAGDNHGTVDVFPALGVSSDTMNVNNGTINTLYGGGTVKDNKGTIFSSRGTVNENHGTIESLTAGNVGTNYKTINRIENTGLLGVNDEGGTVGFVGIGNDIGRNYGTIQETAGLIGRNDGTIGENTGTVNHNYGTVSSNKGTVYMHSGCVGKNEKSGVVLVENTGEADIYINQNEGSVKISSGYVEIEGNTGNIEITNAYVYVGENYGNITLGAGAALEFGANMSDGVITKTDKSASIIYGIADGRIVDETAAWYKIVFEGDDGKAVVKECDKEENGVYYTQSGSIVTFTLPSEYECSAGMIWESGNVNTWVMNADPAEGDTEFTISCHKCTPGNYWMTTEKHWQICAGCGKMLAETEGAHTFGEFVPNDDATCVKDGTETGKCTVCGYKRTRTAVDSHLTSDHHEHIVIDQRVEPT